MPLMGDLKKGDQLLSLCSSLYNTPLIEHEVRLAVLAHPQKPFTDYLLVIKIERSFHSAGLTASPREPSPPVRRTYSASIRRVDRLFVAGKMEPISRVYQPNDENYCSPQDLLEDYLLQKAFERSRSGGGV